MAVDGPVGLVGEAEHRAGQDNGEVLPLVGQRLTLGRREEDMADLEQPDVGQTMAGVEGRRPQEAGQHRRAEQ